METPLRIECIIANQLLSMVSGHACLFVREQGTYKKSPGSFA
uniref:Uncharacterized protein n=1 Tax=Triticum urartu TaxID=4572 RepID=A0A8R7U6Q2_TRIUA